MNPIGVTTNGMQQAKLKGQMADTFKHYGTIESIDGNVIRVRILQASACSGCSAAKLCQSAETKEKTVDVVSTDSTQYSIGDKVQLVGSISQGLKATLWAYVLPLILLVVVLMVCIHFTKNEALSALIALFSLIPYYFVLYTQRDRFKKKFSFRIENSLSF